MNLPTEKKTVFSVRKWIFRPRRAESPSGLVGLCWRYCCCYCAPTPITLPTLVRVSVAVSAGVSVELFLHSNGRVCGCTDPLSLCCSVHTGRAPVPDRSLSAVPAVRGDPLRHLHRRHVWHAALRHLQRRDGGSLAHLGRTRLYAGARPVKVIYIFSSSRRIPSACGPEPSPFLQMIHTSLQARPPPLGWNLPGAQRDPIVWWAWNDHMMSTSGLYECVLVVPCVSFSSCIPPTMAPGARPKSVLDPTIHPENCQQFGRWTFQDYQVGSYFTHKALVVDFLCTKCPVRITRWFGLASWQCWWKSLALGFALSATTKRSTRDAFLNAPFVSSLIIVVLLALQGIEQLKKETGKWKQTSRWLSLKSVFGHPFSYRWFSPFHASPSLRKNERLWVWTLKRHHLMTHWEISAKNLETFSLTGTTNALFRTLHTLPCLKKNEPFRV